MALGTLAAYGIARFRFFRPRNGSLTTWFLSQRVLPPVIFVTAHETWRGEKWTSTAREH